MEKLKEESSMQMIVVAALALLLIVGGLWWKFIGPGAPSPAVKAPVYRDVATGQTQFGTIAEPPSQPAGSSGGQGTSR